jgi:purine-nucleoside phosphorylase
MGTGPLVGPNEDRLGPRFPDLSQPYSARLLEVSEKAAREKQLELGRGVYAAVVGPNLETRAEYRFLRGIGADLVGMSCVPEVLAGVHAGLEILGIGVVTDLCDPDHLEPVDIKNVIRVAGEAGPKLDQLIEATIKKL